MILAIDTYYRDTDAKSVGVLFDWEDEIPKQVVITNTLEVEAYVPGQFYKRELPCILELLEEVAAESVELIIVDGHVFVDNKGGYGLGGHLWAALDERIPVIGVAKRSFFGNKETVIPVCRGVSKNPLFVSSIGIETGKAAEYIEQMVGDYRIPSILKKLDQLTKAS